MRSYLVPVHPPTLGMTDLSPVRVKSDTGSSALRFRRLLAYAGDATSVFDLSPGNSLNSLPLPQAGLHMLSAVVGLPRRHCDSSSLADGLLQ